MKSKIIKRCSDCGKFLSEDDFYRVNKKKNVCQPYCKKCASNRVYFWRLDNKERVADNQRKYRKENKDFIKEYHKIYYKENKKLINVRSKKYYEENKEHLREYQKKYAKEHYDVEKDRKYSKIYYKKNKERINARRKKWRDENEEYVKEYRREYNKEYYARNKEERKKYVKEWQKKNKEHLKEYQKNWVKENRDKHTQYVMKRVALRKNQVPKLTDLEQKKIDLYYTVCNEMGKDFEVDHIKPLSKGGQHHPDNLQILPKQFNREKRDKYPLTKEEKMKFRGIIL